MTFPFYMARRIASSKSTNFSRLILRISIFAVAISVAVMIAASALITGFKNQIGEKIFGFWGHIHISNTAYSISYAPEPLNINQPFYPSIMHLGKVPIADTPDSTFGGVQQIQVFAHKAGIIRTANAMEGIILKGVDSGFDVEKLKPYMVEGRFLQLPDSTPSRDILISQITANRLNLKPGDKFVIHFVNQGELIKRMFQICGIYKTGLEEYDRKFAICDLRLVQQLLNWPPDEVEGFELWLDDIRDMTNYNNYIYEEVLPSDMLSVTIKEKFPAIFEWLQLQDYNEIVILSLMLSVAIINMITAFLVLILERSNMIGILKSIGARDKQVRHIFLYYAGIITLSGMAWGNAIGIGFCLLQEKFKFIKLKESEYYLDHAPIQLDWNTVLLINVGTFALTILFLILPSFAISKISPVKTIRFK